LRPDLRADRRRHNSGIVNEPGNPRSHYFLSHRPAGALYTGPEDWHAKAAPRDGSWWPEWTDWLAGKSSGLVDPPPVGAPEKGLAPLLAAPGSYVFQT